MVDVWFAISSEQDASLFEGALNCIAVGSGERSTISLELAHDRSVKVGQLRQRLPAPIEEISCGIDLISAYHFALFRGTFRGCHASHRCDVRPATVELAGDAVRPSSILRRYYAPGAEILRPAAFAEKVASVAAFCVWHCGERHFLWDRRGVSRDMTYVAAFRNYAAACLARAEMTIDPSDRQFLIEMAAGWHELATTLADYIEEHDGGEPPIDQLRAISIGRPIRIAKDFRKNFRSN